MEEETRRRDHRVRVQPRADEPDRFDWDCECGAGGHWGDTKEIAQQQAERHMREHSRHTAFETCVLCDQKIRRKNPATIKGKPVHLKCVKDVSK